MFRRPCEHLHEIGTVVPCTWCERAVTDPVWQKLWNLPVTAKPRPAKKNRRERAARDEKPAKEARPRRIRTALPCIHEGPIISTCGSCGIGSGPAELRHRRQCSHKHAIGEDQDGCTRTFVSKQFVACDKCRYYQTGPLEWLSTRKLADETVRLLLPKLPPNLGAICGVPRSGLIPASILATLLHLPLYTLEGGEMKPVGHGGRGFTIQWGGDRNGPILLVDDTIYTGGSMVRARAKLAGKDVLCAAMYVKPEAKGVVDFYGRLLPSPHMIEWCHFASGMLVGNAKNRLLHGGFALDFDGILCQDGNPQQPRFLSRGVVIPHIITGRGEGHRQATLDWMARFGMKVDRLTMRPSEVGTDWESIAKWKGGVFDQSPEAIYIESDPSQAKLISKIAGKPVICPGTEQVFQELG